MRRTIVGLGLLVFALPTFAASPERRTNPVSSAVRLQANAYANQIVTTIQHIQQTYYREVSGPALAEAALVSLYEIAREPLPSGLKADLARTDNLNDLRSILVSARERLGDSEAIRGQRGMFISIRALTRVLDPYTCIPSRNDSRRAFTSSSGVTGIGIEVEGEIDVYPLALLNDDMQMPRLPVQPISLSGPLRITDVLPGGPAQLAGVRPGDVITQIDGSDLNETTTPKLVPRLSAVAPDGATAKVTLTVRRPGKAEPIRVELIPVHFRPETVFGVTRHMDNSWDYWLDRQARIAYVRVGFIDRWTDDNTGAEVGTDVDLHRALADLLASGMKGLVLDLRGCPGGFINPAVRLIGLFVKGEATVATVKSKNKQSQPEGKYTTSGDAPLVEGIPIIVLVNGETVGGGEMIAAALQDNHIAKVAGQQTFGKGSVQTTDRVPNTNVPYKMTTGMIYRPNGKPLQRFPGAKPGDAWGVKPDRGLEIPLTPDLNKQLNEWMRLQVLRPGDARERLPLDDPENDPARQFALRKLRERVK